MNLKKRFLRVSKRMLNLAICELILIAKGRNIDAYQNMSKTN